MRRSEPRVAPVSDDQMSDEQKKLLAPLIEQGWVDNVFRTMIRHPKLYKRWIVFANHVLFKSTLLAREREIAILRVGWLCQAEYEWGQHVEIGKRAGITDEEIDKIVAGPDADWSPADRALMQAVDELHQNKDISDDTWDQLKEHYSDKQIMDLVFAVGQYTLVSMALNTFGVQLDERLSGFPK